MYKFSPVLQHLIYLFISKAKTKEMFEEDLDISSGSDFDDDEDPDKIEVPGKFHFQSIDN